MIIPIVIVAVACILICYFSATHSVLKTFSRKRLTDLLTEQGRERQAQFVSDNLSELQLMTGLLRACCGLTMVLGILYAVETHLGQSTTISPWPFVWAFLIATVCLGIFSVAIPVSWAQYRSERLLAWSVPLLRVLMVLTLPVTKPLTLFDPVVRRISGVDLHDDDDDLSDQVMAAVEDHEEGDTVAEEQKQMIEAVFDLDDTDAGEIMTPRTEVQGIELPATLAEVKSAVLEYGHSRVPVYRESLDDVVGILYAKDLIELLHIREDSDPAVADSFDLESLLREPMLIPESKDVLDLLREFRATKVHMAIVLDEYGGTAGLITIEDILEEIVGEIQDEYEPEDEPPEVIEVNDKVARVEARTHIDDLNDQLGLDLPEDEDYDTVGGFVFATLGHIPEVGETFEANGVKVTVDEAERTKVIAVTVEKLAAVPEAS
ncbi:hemolysin family protein [Algisphaera agarilytica]|uniref:CBS domain containing-hemolysin-like protein n=1 Tax=Algisphaera agarilytica TaxID=1385975 RepID=A0A7X0H8C3_9BACT|nr:hemolysin family protein [Algisphaera agarilytica]MBB6430912.1 CBS domain containing-hemolysin-like protein [Algisphaera agarilytica]